MQLTELLEQLAQKSRDELASMPEVVEGNTDLDVSKLPIGVRKWTRMSDIVAVVADLKSSTSLGIGKRAPSTAAIYEAATGGAVKVFASFDADFVQIQGDGAFALFWGEKRYERALCAGITVKTMSLDLTKRLENKWPQAPETGFKVGISSGRVLVKRVGTPRNPSQQEPVWAGSPVNYATKAAQWAGRHELVVTGSVWDRIEKIDYLTFSCDCSEPTGSIWSDTTIDKLPEDDPERAGRLLTSAWCDTHGEEYCNAVLDGRTDRPELISMRNGMLQGQMENSFRAALKTKREQERIRRRGFSG